MIYGSRPCISYWKLPTVAPPALLQITLPMTSDNLSPSLDEGVDRQQEQQNIKPDIDENLPTDYSADTDASSVVPTAFSLTFQPGTYNFQQPIFNSEVTQFITTPALLNYLRSCTLCSRVFGINNNITTNNIGLIWQLEIVV